MDEQVLATLQSRLRSSRAGRMVITSTPTIEAYGISRLMDRSDERHYDLGCGGCGAWEEPAFPESVNWDRLTVVCRQCGADLDPERPGRWVAQHPQVEAIRGYQLSRLILPNPPLAQMRLAMEGKVPTTKENFHRHELGQPYVSEDARLSLADLDRCVAPWSLREDIFVFKKCVMGVDVGKRLHVVIRGFFEGRWYLDKVFTCESFDELDPLFERHRITACVVDALPETRSARAFYERHRWEVSLCLYANQGMTPHWDYVDNVRYVRAPRTLAIDSMLHMFKSAAYALPPNYRQVHGGEYIDHLLAPVRVQELDGFGHLVATYKHTRPDDFAHAEVYAALAIERGWFGGDFIQLAVGPRGFEIVGDGSPHPDLKFRRGL